MRTIPGPETKQEQQTRFSLFMMILLPLVALFAANSARGADSAVILQYHHFGSKTPAVTSIPVEQFKNHLDYLLDNGFRIWPVEKIVSALQKGKELPERCVGLTIDDAYLSVYQNAFPLLKERHLPCTVFVPTRAVDQGLAGCMTWDQMRKMQASRITFASHSHSHPHLIRKKKGESREQWLHRIEAEIQRSRDRLAAELGNRSDLFAYPYGEYNRAVENLIQSLGLIAFGQQSGPIWTGSDFRALPRFPMSGVYADLKGFRIKVNSLPLPVVVCEPKNPVLGPDNGRPALKLRLAPGEYRKEQLNCFVSGQGRTAVEWMDQTAGLLRVRARKPLPPGRSRYNLTAPEQNGHRFYWYSHLWIREKGE